MKKQKKDNIYEQIKKKLYDLKYVFWKEPILKSLKMVDTYEAITLSPISYPSKQLNQIQKGTNLYNRIGNKVNNEELQMYWRFVPTFLDLEVPVNFSIKIVVVYDKTDTSGGLVPTYETIYQGTDFLGNTTTTSVITPLNVANSERFIVLYEEELFFPNIALIPQTAYDMCLQDLTTKVRRKITIPLNGLTTRYRDLTNFNDPEPLWGRIYIQWYYPLYDQIESSALGVEFSSRLIFSDF